jgi:L,D-peptidoglycan transpeptidase YkuD (ErfK/YbiS/YcfS/YnhG family)
MDLIVENAGSVLWGQRRFRCAVGPSGIIPAAAKREGDGATPAGRWPIREILYRADKVARPETKFPVRELRADDGWCEMPGDPNYNKLVQHPYPGADHMWREDGLYDVAAVLGYNDDPIVSGKGSAIFMHVARTGFSPSAGCVTLRLTDLLIVLREADISTQVDIRLA